MKKILINHKKLVRLSIVLTMLILAGCSKVTLEPIPTEGVILAFGDSLTQGYGADKHNSYPEVLARLTGLTVINAGVSGETTQQGLERIEDEFDEYQPDLLILIEGGNDILRNKSLKNTKANLAKMIELSQHRDIPVVLIAVPQKKLFSNSAPLYSELAEKYKLVFDDSLIGSLQRSPSLKSDYVHFNKAGYEKMAHSIYELLQDNGALQ